MQRACYKCKVLKEVNDANFSRVAHGPRDGFSSYCKSCMRIYNRAWYRAIRPYKIQVVRRWQIRNPEKFKVYLKRSSEKLALLRRGQAEMPPIGEIQ